MSNKEPGRPQAGVRLRRNRKSGFWATSTLVLVTMAGAAALLAACGPTQPTSAPTVVAATAISAPGTPAATRVPDPTKTPAPVLSDTPLPTQTPSPTATPPVPTVTATPVPTDTPVPTRTPVPPTDTPVPPTDTPVPPTDTPRVTATKPPPPTHTPAPQPRFPWRGQVVGTFSNCGLTRLMGLTLDRNGGIAGDIWVHFWADGWDGAWARSTWGVNDGYSGLDDSSNWDGVLATYSKDGTWNVCVVPAEGSWDCISTTVTAQTVADPCATDSGGVQVVRIVFQQN